MDSFNQEVLVESLPHVGHWVGSLHASGREEIRLHTAVRAQEETHQVIGATAGA